LAFPGDTAEQDRFGWNRFASIETWRPKRESCSIPYIVEQDSRSVIEAKCFDQKRSCSIVPRCNGCEQRLAMTARGSGWLAAALGAVLFALAGTALAQEPWHTMTGPDRTFTAELPAAPKYTPTQVATPAGVAYTMHQYQLEQAETAFIVQSVLYPKDVNISNPQMVLQSSLERTAKSMDGGKWTSIDWIKQAGGTAVEAVGLRGGSELRSYSVLKGRQLYIMIYIGPPGTARSTDADRFIASLKLGS
jgi:hypothetical protein